MNRDDAAALLLAHERRRVPRAVPGALQVHRDDRVPLRLAHVEDHPVAQDAGVVHQDVEAAELWTAVSMMFFAAAKSDTES